MALNLSIQQALRAQLGKKELARASRRGIKPEQTKQRYLIYSFSQEKGTTIIIARRKNPFKHDKVIYWASHLNLDYLLSINQL